MELFKQIKSKVTKTLTLLMIPIVFGMTYMVQEVSGAAPTGKIDQEEYERAKLLIAAQDEANDIRTRVSNKYRIIRTLVRSNMIDGLHADFPNHLKCFLLSCNPDGVCSSVEPYLSKNGSAPIMDKMLFELQERETILSLWENPKVVDLRKEESTAVLELVAQKRYEELVKVIKPSPENKKYFENIKAHAGLHFANIGCKDFIALNKAKHTFVCGVDIKKLFENIIELLSSRPDLVMILPPRSEEEYSITILVPLEALRTQPATIYQWEKDKDEQPHLYKIIPAPKKAHLVWHVQFESPICSFGPKKLAFQDSIRGDQSRGTAGSLYFEVDEITTLEKTEIKETEIGSLPSSASAPSSSTH